LHFVWASGGGFLIGLGVLGLIIGVAWTASASGRIGPATTVKNSSSCCGCSCVVLVLILPATSIWMFVSHGIVASIASLPVTLGLTWVPSLARTAFALAR
jgi:hypothetical protein